jgi:hypothetical protein
MTRFAPDPTDGTKEELELAKIMNDWIYENHAWLEFATEPSLVPLVRIIAEHRHLLNADNPSQP